VVTRGGAAIADAGDIAAGRTVSAAVRPEHVTIDANGALAGTIGVVENLGHQTYVFVETDDGRVCLLVDRERRPRTGDAVRLAVRASHVHLFDPVTGTRLP
jgi:ABC-type sugar transport system ATPase subunit